MVNRMGDNSTVQQMIPKAEARNIDKEVTGHHLSGVNKGLAQSDTEKQLSPNDAKKMTDSLNKFLETSNTELRFKYHEELKEYYVTIVNSKDEVVREIPSKKLLDIFAAMQDFLGLLVDRKI